MVTHIPAPTRLEAAGNKSKCIDEYVGGPCLLTLGPELVHRDPSG